MREFMDYIQSAFYTATGWNRDNSYSSLNATSDALLSFPTPRGLRLTLSSLATPQFATSYQLGSIGVVDGSLSYLYSTVPLHSAIAQSSRIPLPDLLKSYRPLSDLVKNSYIRHGWDGGAREKQETLAYGRLYLPMSMLEALVVRRVSPALQWQVSAVSNQTLRNGGTVLGMCQYDTGRYGLEGLASSDGGLLGLRGLYNFGGDIANLDATKEKVQDHGNGDRIHGRFSTGAELYYGTLNKSGGMSVGIRFATLPSHNGTPLTATMTINPLMGSVSWSYAVMAGSFCSLATRMSFNVYSYESDWAVGMELWRKKGTPVVSVEDEELTIATPPKAGRSFQAKMEWRLDDPITPPDRPDEPAGPAVIPEESLEFESREPTKRERSFQARMDWKLDESEEEMDVDPYSGVLKARLDQHLRLGLLWEGRAKSLLFSLGSGIDLRRLDSPFRTLGLEVQFSS
ncbi:Mitochondrial distribution and morphology protein 10 [Diatrype stigma]|uniref:Mitochondrial distribution and morphology protein 10 n=1 Tax=Diatrype stigma TaxID=117547 RepID=A0AAN9UYA6_9PEZI